MSYLQLFPSTRFEYYGSDGIVFDVLGDTRYELDNDNALLFSELINGKQYVKEEYSEKINKLISCMMKDGILYAYNSPKYYDAMRFHNVIEVKGMFDIAPWFENIYIEASLQCDNNCEFCRMSRILEGCKVCTKWQDKGNMIDQEILIASIERLICIPTKSVKILGGNPLLNWGYISSVIEVIRERSQDISITLNMTDLDFPDDILIYLERMNVRIKAIITNKTNVESVIQRAGKLRAREISVEIVILGYYSDIIRISKLNEICKERFETVEVIDYKDRPHTLPDFEERKRLQIDDTFVDRKGNRCTNRSIALALSGDVTICPAMSEVIQNVKDKDIEEIFYDDRIGKHWGENRESIKGCDKCPLKWLCRDCYSAVKRADNLGLRGEYFCGRESKEIDSIG